MHGHPRYTKDIGLWIENTTQNAQKMIAAIDQFRTLAGVEFSKCNPNKVEVDLDGVKADFIDLESLILNKTASGRMQDLADVDNLQP